MTQTEAAKRSLTGLHENERTAAKLLRTGTDADPFSPEDQQSYLFMLSRGASPAAACQQLGLSLLVVATAIEKDSQFSKLLARVNELLSQNVAAALYRSAMEGSVSAQTFFLKNRPPPEWPERGIDDQKIEIEGLTDDELIARFRAEAPALLARLSAGDSPAAGVVASGSVSRSVAPSE